MGLNITQGFNINSPKSLDEKYGVFSNGVTNPYGSVAEANSTYPSSYRKGKTVWVLKNGVGVEYWWRDGNLNTDLIEKVSIGSGGGINNFIPLDGTTLGNPVTGDINFLNANIILKNTLGARIITYDEGNNLSIDFVDINNNVGTYSHRGINIASGCYTSSFNLDNSGNFKIGPQSDQNSVVGNYYYGPSYQDLSFVQKLYVDTAIAAISTSGSQTPWLSDIDAAGYSLNNAQTINASEIGTSSLQGNFLNISGLTGMTFQSLATGQYNYFGSGSSYLTHDYSAMNGATKIATWRNLSGTVAYLSDITGGSSTRFGIEDNTGVQNRLLEMDQFNLKVDHANLIEFKSRNSGNTQFSYLRLDFYNSALYSSGPDGNSYLGVEQNQAYLQAVNLAATGTQMRSGIFIIEPSVTITKTYAFRFRADRADGLQMNLFVPYRTDPGLSGGLPEQWMPLSVNGNFANASGNITIPSTQWVTSGSDIYYSAGKVGIGISSSISAKLHLAAGTTTGASAPIKFTAGPLMTTRENGALEYYSDDLYFSHSFKRNRIVINSAPTTYGFHYGYNAGTSNTGDFSIFLGFRAGEYSGTTEGAIFMGTNTGAYATGSTYGVFIGSDAGANSTGANNSIFLGSAAGSSNVGTSSSILIGEYAGQNMNNADHSIAIGSYCGRQVSSSYSILIGNKVAFTSVAAAIGSNNVIIGNNISVGSTTSNSINLGGVLFGINTYSTQTGDSSVAAQSTGKVGLGIVATSITARLHLPAGTTAAGMAPLKLTTASAALMTTPEAGAFETDGTDLYWTNNAGVRKKVTLV